MRYTFNNLTDKTRELVVTVLHVIAHSSEAIIFLLFGITAFDMEGVDWSDVQFWLWSYLFCTVYRVVSVAGVGFFINWYSGNKSLDSNILIIMGWGGLRGAVSFIMAHETPDESKLVDRGTLFVIMVTCILQGSTIELLVKHLKMFQPKMKVSE